MSHPSTDDTFLDVKWQLPVSLVVWMESVLLAQVSSCPKIPPVPEQAESFLLKPLAVPGIKMSPPFFPDPALQGSFPRLKIKKNQNQPLLVLYTRTSWDSMFFFLKQSSQQSETINCGCTTQTQDWRESQTWYCSSNRDNFGKMTANDSRDGILIPVGSHLEWEQCKSQEELLLWGGTCLQLTVCIQASTGVLSVGYISFMPEFSFQEEIYCLGHTEKSATSARYPEWFPFQILMRWGSLQSSLHHQMPSLRLHVRIRVHQNFTNGWLLWLMKVCDQNR